MTYKNFELDNLVLAKQIRTTEIYTEERAKLFERTDRSFLYLFGVQYVLSIVIAFVFSPRAWQGNESQIHEHVWQAVLFGILIFSLPSYLITQHAGRTITRHVIAVAQMLFGALLIHLLDGRIETHFHVFGSLAFLAFYKDWKVLVTASIVVALDHLLRGFYFPQSAYGIPVVESWRWLEHSTWVVFEDIFLFYSCHHGMRDIFISSGRQAELEVTNATIEQQVENRTRELKEAHYQLDAQRAKSAQANKMAAIGQMAGGIAHEINTPLSTLQLLTSQLAVIETATPAHKAQLDKIHSRIDLIVSRIAEAITALRKFAKDNEDEPVEHIESDRLVDEAVDLWRNKIDASGIAFKLEADSNVELDCRPTQIKQVLFSLLSNSYDAVKDPSAREKVISIRTNARDQFVDFIVEDSGRGILPENRERIFEPFFTTKDVGQGSGLGLSVSLSIVEKHGGTLRLDHESTPTRFVISLPRLNERKECA